MKSRIQKIISQRGVASRRTAEEMILQGRVSCNGIVCQLGDRADPEIDTILLDGEPLPKQESHVYIMLNKPRGYVTTLSDEKGRKNAAQLISGCGKRVYPVGRLDMDSDGLLLFTNDGELANRLMHPRNEISKTYRVSVSGYSEPAMKRLLQPMSLDGYLIKIPQVALVREDHNGFAIIDITIHEGRNRQVRRMCAIAGMQVQTLTRILEGPLQLGNLIPGQWRYLTEAEVLALKQ